MAYIYKIENDINGKIYIGKTELTIEKRFKQHCIDSQKRKNENRPLYKAMNKYGVEHFHISLIEETNIPEERERYWIEQYRSFKNGYNATLGGDGRSYIDYDLVITVYFETHSMKDTAEKLKIDSHTVSKIIHSNKIKPFPPPQSVGTLVNQYDLDGNYITTFSSIAEAAASIKGKEHHPGYRSKISDVCKGKRKTALGYKWKYTDIKKGNEK